MTVAEHPVGWLTAAPLWSRLLARDPGREELARMQRPTILRMASDDFMEDLAAMLGEDPRAVAELEARPKSYRAAPPGAGPAYEPPIDHVKLFQPIHGHFNLVAATLVCRVPGLPDKRVDTGADESAGFVLRRVAGTEQLAWCGEDWVSAPSDELAPGETVVTMFGMPYADGDRRRRLFVGLLPTASLDSFPSGGKVSFSPQGGDRGGKEPPDRRLETLEERVIAPLKQVGELRPDATRRPPMEMSRFLLLDLADFLVREVPRLWQAVQSRSRPADAALAAAFDLLRDRWADSVRGRSWLDAVNAVWGERERIWGEPGPAPAYEVDLWHAVIDPAQLRSVIVAALPARTAAHEQEPQPPFEAPKLDPRPTVRYVVRCVYRRPRCGPLHPDVLSDASQEFAIAPFLDFDAPARPVHISLPIDTSIAGLRKAPKNVRILISKELRQQMARVEELRSDEPVDLGMICSFSIPIITICALVVLMVFLYVLNIVFWWLPFFRICFPVPVGKES